MPRPKIPYGQWVLKPVPPITHLLQTHPSRRPVAGPCKYCGGEPSWRYRNRKVILKHYIFCPRCWEELGLPARAMTGLTLREAVKRWNRKNGIGFEYAPTMYSTDPDFVKARRAERLRVRAKERAAQLRDTFNLGEVMDFRSRWKAAWYGGTKYGAPVKSNPKPKEAPRKGPKPPEPADGGALGSNPRKAQPTLFDRRFKGGPPPEPELEDEP